MQRPVPTFTHLHVEASLCLWEALLELESSLNEKLNAIYFHMHDIGSCQARSNCIDLGPWIDDVWQGLGEDVQQTLIPYDWEFVPGLMQFLTPDGWTLKPAPVAEVVQTLTVLSWVREFAQSVAR